MTIEHIAIWTKNIERLKVKIDTLRNCLSKLFNDKKAQEYKNELKLAYKNKDRYYLLKKKISFIQYKELRDFPLVKMGKKTIDVSNLQWFEQINLDHVFNL